MYYNVVYTVYVTCHVVPVRVPYTIICTCVSNYFGAIFTEMVGLKRWKKYFTLQQYDTVPYSYSFVQNVHRPVALPSKMLSLVCVSLTH